MPTHLHAPHTQKHERTAPPARTRLPRHPASVLRRRRAPDGEFHFTGLTAHEVTDLQRSLGNGTVQRLFGSKKKKKTVGPDTRSQARKAFDESTFEKKDWRPTTGTGKFDAVYKPSDGILRIIMRVHFNFQDADPAYKDTAEDPKEMKWSSSGKKDWAKKWIDSVQNKWG